MGGHGGLNILPQKRWNGEPRRTEPLHGSKGTTGDLGPTEPCPLGQLHAAKPPIAPAPLAMQSTTGITG